MKPTRGIAALAGVLLIVCAVVAWEWYAHVSGPQSAPHAVQQIAASTASPAAPTPAAPPRSPGPQTPAPSASPGPVTYVPVQSPSAAPSTSAGAAAKPTPYAVSGGVSGQPVVASTLAPHVVRVRPIAEAPNAPPRILAMSLSTPVARAGQVVSGTVQTSSNVASVEARIAGYSSSMRKVGVGKFALSYRVPNLPFFLHRTYQVEVIARNTRGDAVRTSVPITIR